MKIPGIVDLQVNGYKGVNFSGSDLTESDFMQACRQYFAAGTTAFLPTVITSPEDVYKHNLPIIAKAIKSKEFGSCLLGIHLEGPFISPEEGARGAHNRQWIRKPDIGFLKNLLEWADGTVRVITIAADAPGAEELAQYAVEQQITVSLGHHLANQQDLQKLTCAGATALTHLGNGVPAVLPRHNNPIWAALADDELTAMVITDGHHLPASLIKTIVRAKGPQRCIVVSDAAPQAGLPPGKYDMSGTAVILQDDEKLHDPTTGYLAGSSATLLQCMNHLASLKLLSADELVAMGFYNPLKLIGLKEFIPAGPSEAVNIVGQESNIYFDENRQFFYLEKQKR